MIDFAKGLDLSHHNKNVNFEKIAKAWDFVFLKATDGVKFVDSTFAARWPEAKRAGLVRGAYHYYRPDESGAVQAEHFLKTLGQLEVGDLPCVFDWEERAKPGTPNVDREIQMREAKKWLQIVERETGAMPIIYTYPDFMNTVIEPGQEFSEWPLWVAHWRARKPSIPKPWPSWHFWQTNDKGFAHGVGGKVDTNLFQGDKITLGRLCKQ